MDETDLKVIGQLQRDGRLTMAQLAQRVGLSGPAVADRVRKLEQQGVILGYAAQLNPRALGMGLLCFINVTVDHREEEQFLQVVDRRPEVLECHHVAGEDCYILKVLCRDTDHLEELITNGLKAHIRQIRTRTTIVLKTTKASTRVPLEVGYDVE